MMVLSSGVSLIAAGIFKGRIGFTALLPSNATCQRQQFSQKTQDLPVLLMVKQPYKSIGHTEFNCAPLEAMFSLLISTCRYGGPLKQNQAGDN